MNRKAFLRSIIGVPAFFTTSFAANPSTKDDISHLLKAIEKTTSGSMIGFAADPIPKVKVGIIGMGNRGNTLLEMFQWLVQNGRAEIVGLSDIVENKVIKAKEKLAQWQKPEPKLYFNGENDWQKLVQQEDVDLLVITTPWKWHASMCIYGMEQGKHVASEVPIAYTMAECWELVETAERTQRHCIMMENCCYNEEELWVLNMIQNGVFGNITHTEGAYLHDLRALLLSEDYYQDQWRIQHHVTRDGNFYTTHGLGPIAFYLNIGRGDTFDFLTSMSSRELNLSQAAKQAGAPYTQIKCGDMNNTMIKTKQGKTILLQFDVHTGRPYSRINKVVGTKAVHDGYPSRLYIEPEEPTYWGHKWLEGEAYQNYREKYTHPIIKKLKTVSQEFKQGHGGMDFVMMYRLITCLNEGLPLDINVYDSVMWSAVTPLSELSVASNSLPLPFPDFTGGGWKEASELEVMRGELVAK